MKKRSKIFIAGNAAFLALVAAGGLFYILFGRNLKEPLSGMIKALTNVLFLLTGLFNLVFAIVTRQTGYKRYKYLLLAGLIASAVADSVLNLNTLAGIILLSVGHLLFHLAFDELKPFGWKDLIPCVAVTVFTLCMLLLLPAYDFGALFVPVIIYGVLLSLMLGNAIGIMIEDRIALSVRLSVFAGAALFFVSDAMLSVHSFTDGGAVFDILCLSAYYPAQFLLALSIGLTALCGEEREGVQMNVFLRLYCRAVQGLFRIASPFLPYRRPVIINSCADIANVVREQGKNKVFLITGKKVRAHGLTKPVEESLAGAGIAYTVFDSTSVNPTVQNVETALEVYTEEHCDCVIAVGGGSVIDCAKAVIARLARPSKTLSQMRGVLKVRGKVPLLIAVPTTAGAGSETTIAAVITDGETHDKFTVIAFCLAPKYAVLDPAMTISLPPAPTAETGMDALTHAVEAYIGHSTTRETRRLSVHAVALIRENLLTAYTNGADENARRNMQLAAFEAGYAFSQSYVGYVHALAHSLGGKYDYPHGRTNAVLLPHVLRAYGKSCYKRLASLAKKSGVADKKDNEITAAQKFIAFAEGLNRDMNIPERLDIEEGDIPALALHAAKEANPLYPVPRLMSAKALEEIYFTVRALPPNETDPL